MLRVMRDPTVADPRRDEMARAAAPYVHAKISPENTKTTDNHITLLQLVLGSYEFEEKAKQIEGPVGKPARRNNVRACTHKFAMSALPPKADIAGRQWDVRFVPILLQKSVASFFGR
jgi:hypothetical protein